MNLPRNTRHVRHSRSSHQSKSFSHTKRKRIIWAVILSCLIVALFLFSAVRFFSLGAFEITSVQIFGADQDIVPDLEASASTSIAGKYIGLFDRSDIFIYSKNKLIANIKTASPRVADVTVRRDGLHTLIVTVNQKIPAALICTNLPDWNDSTLSLDSSDTCYFVDQTGYVFEQAPTFSGHVYNRYYIPGLLDTSTTTASALGLHATSSAEFASLQSFYDGVRTARIDAEAILMKQGGEYEMYVSSKAPSDAVSTTTPLSIIYFNDSRPFDTQLDNLTSFWKNMMNTALADKKPINFDYIDVRYGSNVFYKVIDGK